MVPMHVSNDMNARVSSGFKKGVCPRLLIGLFTMGSTKKGDLCVLCRRHKASYIPDGVAGPICFDPLEADVQAGLVDDYEGCYEKAQRLGWSVVENDYYLMCWNAKTMVLSKKITSRGCVLTKMSEETQARIATFVFDAAVL